MRKQATGTQWAVGARTDRSITYTHRHGKADEQPCGQRDRDLPHFILPQLLEDTWLRHLDSGAIKVTRLDTNDHIQAMG